jgi:uncharacterized protein YggT (Ycf19 family)
VYRVVASLLNAFVLVCVARALLSWVPSRAGAVNAIRGAVDTVTDPVVVPVRRALSKVGLSGRPFDLSLLVVIFGVNFVILPLAAVLLN